jgi:hypothetical protein
MPSRNETNAFSQLTAKRQQISQAPQRCTRVRILPSADSTQDEYDNMLMRWTRQRNPADTIFISGAGLPSLGLMAQGPTTIRSARTFWPPINVAVSSIHPDRIRNRSR